MFTLTKEFRFEAAHRLPQHDGKCARLHGHSFKMRVVVTAQRLVSEGPKLGMVIDYSELSQIVSPLVEACLDHHYLNDSTGLPNPTSEELARWIFYRLQESLPELIAVEVDETCTASCRFEEDAN